MPELLGRVGVGAIEVIAAMPRCGTCCHWVADRLSMSRARPETGEWGECDRITLSDEGATARSYGDFATKAEFGCALWEPRS